MTEPGHGILDPPGEITSEARAFGIHPTAEVLDELVQRVEDDRRLLGPVVSADLRQGTIALLATVQVWSPTQAQQILAKALGEALVAVGAADGYVRADKNQAVVA